MALSYKDLLQKSSLIKKIVMVSLGKGDSSCTLVNWFIAKFCMFFTGRHGQTKTSLDICQFFLFNPRQILCKRIVFWICFCLPCFPFGAVQSIPASRSINCANLQSIPSFVRCYQFQVPVWLHAVSNIYSLSSGLIHLLLIGRHIVLIHLLSLVCFLLSFPLGRKLGSLPLSLLLLPLLALLLLLLIQLLPPTSCCCCCSWCYCYWCHCRFLSCCCCHCCCFIHWSQRLSDEVVRQSCNESPSSIVDDRVFRKLATLD